MRIVFVPEALADIMTAILLCPVEISGLGRIKRLGASEFLVKEALIFEQECSSATTEFDPAAKGRWENRMARAGRGAEINEYRLWWHSHVCGPAYFSAVDQRNIHAFDIGNWKDAPVTWWVSLVGNKFGEMAARVDEFAPRRTSEPCEITTTVPLTRDELRGLIGDRVPFVRQTIAENVKMDMRILSREEMRNPRWR